MEILFVILRFLLGPTRFQSDQVEPIVVMPNGRTTSVRDLPPDHWRSWYGMCWPTFRHMFHDPLPSDAAARRDLWWLTRSPHCGRRPERLRA